MDDEDVEQLWNAIQYLLRMLGNIEERLDRIEKRLDEEKSPNR